MILADSSAWIAFLRASGSPAHRRVHDLLGTGDLASTDIVMLEVLAGTCTEGDAELVRRLLMENEVLPMLHPDDAELGASLYRSCRRKGITVRKLNDCLIAAVAIRTGVAVLHEDRDFEALARHTNLLTVTT